MTTFSDLAVSMLISKNPRIQKIKFRKSVAKWLKGRDVGHPDEILSTLGFRPDAFLIDGNEIICYEVEDTHPITMDKLSDLTTAWFILDYDNIDLRLIVLDRYGMNEREIDLGAYYVHTL